jgi:1-acyl-sn-glycerol-3-phosphate acyltransferase
MDTVFAIYYYYPTIVSRESSKHIPFVGAGLKAMNTVFVARAGADAKESKRQA